MIEHSEHDPVLGRFLLSTERNKAILVPILFPVKADLREPLEPTSPARTPIAIYEFTGRGPFRMKDGREGWEYRFAGIECDG